MTIEQQTAQWYGVTWRARDVIDDGDDRVAVDGEDEDPEVEF